MSETVSFLKKKCLLWNIQPSPNIAHSCLTCNVLNSLNIYQYFLSLHHMFGKNAAVIIFFLISKQLPSPYHSLLPDMSKPLLVFAFRMFKQMVSCSSTVNNSQAVGPKLSHHPDRWGSHYMINTSWTYISWKKFIEFHGLLRSKSLHASQTVMPVYQLFCPLLMTEQLLRTRWR